MYIWNDINTKADICVLDVFSCLGECCCCCCICREQPELLLCSARSGTGEEQPWCLGSARGSESSEIGISPLRVHPAFSNSCHELQLTSRARVCCGITVAVEEKRFSQGGVNWTDTSPEVLWDGQGQPFCAGLKPEMEKTAMPWLHQLLRHTSMTVLMLILIIN